MRRRACASWACGAAGIAVAVYLAGCVFRTPIDCENALVECGAGGGTSSSTSSSASSSGTGGALPGCAGDPTTDATLVRDECFVFASASAKAGGKGTKAAPFASLQEAIDAVKSDGRRVLACADKPFAEEIVVPAGAEVVGGFDCAAWGWTEVARTTIAPGVGKVPLKLTSGTGTTMLHSLSAVAADAVDPGGSSIAAIIDGGTGSPLSVAIAQCDFSAGKGAAGAPGTTPMGTGENGTTGNPGNPGCASMSSVLGGDAMIHTCGADTSIGGAGGIGSTAIGGAGSPGKVPPQVAQPVGQNGEPGQGEDVAACTSGGQGAPGASGDPGGGAAGIGSIDAKGFFGAAGAAGVSEGKPGQGGGGGGGAKAGHCMNPANAGPSGGGGGSGGCGGLPGGGGAFGGSSIAILGLNAEIMLTSVKVSANNGGDGGDGGEGQSGGVGGSGGITDNNNGFACAGGKGGQGGAGGKGGGGLGGHSIGLAYSGATTPSTSGVTFSKGTPGKGGKGAADMMHDGEAGVQADVHVFQ